MIITQRAKKSTATDTTERFLLGKTLKSVLKHDSKHFLTRFKGLNESIRVKGSSGTKQELRLRKSSQTEVDKNISDDEIVESCKVRTLS